MNKKIFISAWLIILGVVPAALFGMRVKKYDTAKDAFNDAFNQARKKSPPVSCSDDTNYIDNNTLINLTNDDLDHGEAELINGNTDKNYCEQLSNYIEKRFLRLSKQIVPTDNDWNSFLKIKQRYQWFTVNSMTNQMVLEKINTFIIKYEDMIKNVDIVQEKPIDLIKNIEFYIMFLYKRLKQGDNSLEEAVKIAFARYIVLLEYFIETFNNEHETYVLKWENEFLLYYINLYIDLCKNIIENHAPNEDNYLKIETYLSRVHQYLNYFNIKKLTDKNLAPYKSIELRLQSLIIDFRNYKQ